MTTSPPAQQEIAPIGRYTGWPRAGASAVILRDGHVLLVERGKGASRGMWSFPGGHIEPGEHALAAAQREVLEETGVDARVVGLLDIQDVIIRDRFGALVAHYLLAVHWGTAAAGDAMAASDAADARFVPMGELDRFHLTQGARRFIDLAVARLGAVR
jgi:8-oxo-dGTP diphosphatase